MGQGHSYQPPILTSTTNNNENNARSGSFFTHQPPPPSIEPSTGVEKRVTEGPLSPKISSASRLRLLVGDQLGRLDLRRRSMPSQTTNDPVVGGGKGGKKVHQQKSVDNCCGVGGGDESAIAKTHRRRIKADAWAISLFKASPPRIQINGKETLGAVNSLNIAAQASQLVPSSSPPGTKNESAAKIDEEGVNGEGSPREKSPGLSSFKVTSLR